MSLLALMNNRISIGAMNPARSQGGGALRDWTPRATEVPARIEDANSDNLQQFGGWVENITHVIFTFQSDIMIGERIQDDDGWFYIIKRTTNRRAAGSIPRFWVYGAEQVKIGVPS